MKKQLDFLLPTPEGLRTIYEFRRIILTGQFTLNYRQRKIQNALFRKYKEEKIGASILVTGKYEEGYVFHFYDIASDEKLKQILIDFKFTKITELSFKG